VGTINSSNAKDRRAVKRRSSTDLTDGRTIHSFTGDDAIDDLKKDELFLALQ
jgi:hypothetical protein